MCDFDLSNALISLENDQTKTSNSPKQAKATPEIAKSTAPARKFSFLNLLGLGKTS